MTTRPTKSRLRIGLVAPHIFLHRDILPQVIFSPGHLVIDLANGLHALGADVTLFSPGPVEVAARNVTADLSLFEQELAGRGDTYVDLLKKHPFTFVTLARQVQSEMIAKAYAAANAGELDVVHIYTNEEDTALPFAALCQKPVVFTHHDPFNFLVKYKNVFPKYAHLNWVSMSFAQRAGMPADTQWAANIYHGVAEERFTPLGNPSGNYIAYLGRIIQPKGLHLAIAAAKKAGVPLKIAGKHYAGQKDAYWREVIEPQLGETIEYVGFLKDDVSRRRFLGNASALVVPSLFDEPFGMVAIEALACGTPLIGVANGALPEIIRDGNNGLLVQKTDETSMIADMAQAMRDAGRMSRQAARASFEENFTLARMCNEHFQLYQRLAQEV